MQGQLGPCTPESLVRCYASLYWNPEPPDTGPCGAGTDILNLQRFEFLILQDGDQRFGLPFPGHAHIVFKELAACGRTEVPVTLAWTRAKAQ